MRVSSLVFRGGEGDDEFSIGRKGGKGQVEAEGSMETTPGLA